MIKEKTNNIRIIVVDDETEFATTLVTRLTLRKYDAKVATSGQEAINILANNVFDVAIIDLRMPDIDGLELLAHIKDETPEVEVIMLTGHGSFSSGREGMEGGAFDYIMKPVDLNVLLEKIESAYSKKIGM